MLFLIIIYSIKLKWTLCHLILKQEHNSELPDTQPLAEKKRAEKQRKKETIQKAQGKNR